MKNILVFGAVAALGLVGVASLPSTDEGAEIAKPSKAPAPGTSATAASATLSGSPSQLNALKSARNYLEFTPFSRKGLIRQLISDVGEGFPKEDAEWAVKSLENSKEVDWNKQAFLSGERYLKSQPFSRKGLIHQLSSDGESFTVEQATYAADKLGLKA